MEVMGLMLGEFVDEYTVRVIDVFAMPQSGTGVSVEAVDPVFQAKMLDMLKQTGRPEMVVGWYHSHPGFGCWLSGVDINTQQSFEALSDRAVAVVVDPIQSVKGNPHFFEFVRTTLQNCFCRQGGYRRLPPDQPQHDGAGSGAQADHFCSWSSAKAVHSGPHPWPEPTLLLHFHQLSEK